MSPADLIDLFESPSAPGGGESVSSWRDDELVKAKGYLPMAGLKDATKVALLLNQPLLLTGEPGTGKTEYAYYVSLRLGLRPPLIFETKSTSTARDLFYTYDALGRFQDAQLGGSNSINQLDYLTYNALGVAILQSNDEKVVKQWLPVNFGHIGAQRSVILIDEIDKAPRDFPNDILNEIEYMYFKINEIRDPATHQVPRVEIAQKNRPVVIITSNSEKHLPAAFLRRCIYYNIPFPEGDDLTRIVLSRLKHFDNDGTWLANAIRFFSKLREPNNGLSKRPATAELLGWLKVVYKKSQNSKVTFQGLGKEFLELSLSALLKNVSDQQIGKALLEKWLQEERVRQR